MVERFERVLVAAAPGALDPRALGEVGDLVRANRAAISVLDVVEPVPAWRRVVDIEGRDVDIQEMLIDARSDALRRLSDLIGERVDVSVVTGKPIVEVIRRVLTERFDLVVVGEPAPPRAKPGGLSAGVMQLLRKCPAPVWVVRPSDGDPMRILALVDPDPADPVRDGLNGEVLELALAMSRRRHAELHVAHAWDLPGRATLTSSPFLAIPPVELEMMARATADGHRERLDLLVGRYGVIEAGGQVHLVEGDPGDVLPALADELEPTLIVMGTVARTGLSGLIMGNTAETVLRSVRCSVLAVKPEGFESPVRPV